MSFPGNRASDFLPYQSLYDGNLELTLCDSCGSTSQWPTNRVGKDGSLFSEQQLNLVKLLSPTNLRQGVHDERNAYF